jgi:hypothetical protein
LKDDPLMPELAERAAAEERKMAADQAFADKLAKRLPPDAVERAAIEKARRRTKARAPRVATRIAMSAEHTRLILRWRDTAFGSPMRSVPDRSISFIQC